jgi:alkanesulfonate monooxygenase
MERNSSIEVFTTCPPSNDLASNQYLGRLIDVAKWSDEAGCTGMLVFSDNARLDPWSLSHLIIQRTKRLCPLVAIQPIYTHPYWIAKQITTFAFLYGRRFYLNMVAGFKNDLTALNDSTSHDKRYDRLAEYTTIIMRLLASPSPVTYEGEFYSVKSLKLMPPLPEPLMPEVFVSGSSDAGVASAKALNATAIKYPQPSGEETAPDRDLRLGIRVGIIARQRESDAWDVAHACFPDDDRKGQLTTTSAEKVPDSVWHKQLSSISGATPGDASVYWLGPFQNSKATCPYLVGSYDKVGEELATYFGAGYRTVILDTPRDAQELEHIAAAFEVATQRVV